METINTEELIQGSASAQLWANAHEIAGEEMLDLDTETCIEAAEHRNHRWTGAALGIVYHVVAWAKECGEDLTAYMEQTGRDFNAVGHDFALSRAAHGTGLWDRGAEKELGDRMHRKARRYRTGNLLVRCDEHGYIEKIDAL